jgi:hypothetical protein
MQCSEDKLKSKFQVKGDVHRNGRISDKTTRFRVLGDRNSSLPLDLVSEMVT